MINTEFLQSKTEKLESVFLNILYLKPEDRIISPDMHILGDLKDAINSIFSENKCVNVMYTLNTDKQFFGIRINPFMSSSDATIILASDESVKLNKYQIEFDSKLFEIGLDESELAAITIYEISSIMDSSEIFEQVRASIDANLISNDDIINIRDSVNAAQLVIFALKDTMYKFSSILFKEDESEYTLNPAIQACSMEEYLVSARDKIGTSISGLGESLRSPKPIILEWMFLMYRNMKINSGIISDTLKDAKAFTASKLEIAEINKALQAIDRIDMNIAVGESSDINKFFDNKNMSVVNETSLFKNLKKNGLRSIENELYEFALKVKNCTEPEDAYLIIRGINSRLGILEDYLMTEENLSEADRKHWEYVAQQYRELRIKLSEKKLGGKQYGLFFDYSKLDNL